MNAVTFKMRDEFWDEVSALTDEEMQSLAEEAHGIAFELCPKVTRFLAKSIKVVQKAVRRWLLQTESGYGGYVELGTTKMRAQSYLAPSVPAAAKRKGM